MRMQLIYCFHFQLQTVHGGNKMCNLFKQTLVQVEFGKRCETRTFVQFAPLEQSPHASRSDLAADSARHARPWPARRLAPIV